MLITLRNKMTFDLRGEPIFTCICGSEMWNIKVVWDKEDRTIGMYLLEQTCEMCGAIATAPTEIDGNDCA